MTREEMDFIGSMNMCDEISNEAYQKIMTHCEEQQPCDDYVDKKELLKSIEVALDATNMNDEYTIGLRNGMRLVKSFVDDKRPDYEKVSHLKKKEPCEDCISREAVLGIVSGYAERFNGYIDSLNDSEVYAYARGLILSIERNINDVPPVTPQLRWIPCGERLPKSDDEVLVTDDTGGLALVGIDWFDKDSNRWWCSQNVTAWMPLPEPYRGGESDAER